MSTFLTVFLSWLAFYTLVFLVCFFTGDHKFKKHDLQISLLAALAFCTVIPFVVLFQIVFLPKKFYKLWFTNEPEDIEARLGSKGKL